MKYTINGSTVAFNKNILSEESLNTMIKEIDSSYESCSKAIEAYNLVSNVKAMESFGYKATEGLGESIKNGAKVVWEKIKEFFRKIVEFFKRLFQSKKIENTGKKAESTATRIKKLDQSQSELLEQEIKISAAVYDLINNPNYYLKLSEKVRNQNDKTIDDIIDCSVDIAHMAATDDDEIDEIKSKVHSSITTIDILLHEIDGDIDRTGSIDYKITLKEFISKIKSTNRVFFNAKMFCDRILNQIKYIQKYSNDLLTSINELQNGNDQRCIKLYQNWGQFITIELKLIMKFANKINKLTNEINKELDLLKTKYSRVGDDTKYWWN